MREEIFESEEELNDIIWKLSNDCRQMKDKSFFFNGWNDFAISKAHKLNLIRKNGKSKSGQEQ